MENEQYWHSATPALTETVGDGKALALRWRVNCPVNGQLVKMQNHMAAPKSFGQLNDHKKVGAITWFGTFLMKSAEAVR
jgi:hypothetical protein